MLKFWRRTGHLTWLRAAFPLFQLSIRSVPRRSINMHRLMKIRIGAVAAGGWRRPAGIVDVQ
jgi:hypothetical protein